MSRGSDFSSGKFPRIIPSGDYPGASAADEERKAAFAAFYEVRHIDCSVGPSRVCLSTLPLRALRSRSEVVVVRHQLDSHTQRLYSTTSGPCPSPDKRSGRTSSAAQRTKISASCRRCCGRSLSLRCVSRLFSVERPCSVNGPRCRDDHTSSSRAAGTPSPRRRRPFVAVVVSVSLRLRARASTAYARCNLAAFGCYAPSALLRLRRSVRKRGLATRW